jgi:Cu-processing system ATP-binding protein
MISVNHLSKSFSRLEVLKDISVDFTRPGITAVLGPNGSGKTTLIKCLLGMVIPDQGDIQAFGQPVKGQWTYRSQIGYLPQIARFPDNLRVKELIAMIKDIRGTAADEAPLIEAFGLETYLDKKLGHLSGGTKQKVNLLLALLYDTPVIIMDEPTAGLDPVALIRLKDIIQKEKKLGKIILITTHIISLVEEIADEVVFLLEGRIHFRGTPEQLRMQYAGANLEEAIANLLLHENQATAVHPKLTQHHNGTALHKNLKPC